MNSILDILVSCVANYYSKEPRNVNLLTWLTSTKYAHVVDRLRQTENAAERKRLKASLPAITPSGLFSRVDEAHLVRHSGFLQFDIDAKDNTGVSDYDTLINRLSRLENVAYCGRSVSGKGWWGLVPIAHPDDHAGHFRYLQQYFAHMGITIDEAPKNVCALRGYSYDADAYFNHRATALQHVLPPAADRSTGTPHRPAPAMRSRVLQQVTFIEHQGVDITQGYRAWFSIGCELAATFGTDGRELYHRISRYHPQYTARNTDYQYTKCLAFVQQQGKAPGMGYFFKLCA